MVALAGAAEALEALLDSADAEADRFLALGPGRYTLPDAPGLRPEGAAAWAAKVLEVVPFILSARAIAAGRRDIAEQFLVTMRAIEKESGMPALAALALDNSRGRRQVNE